jgi:hypothetical protein
MNIIKSKLWPDIKKIVNTKKMHERFYEAWIITPKKTVKAKKVVSIDIIKNYKDQTGPEMWIKCYFGLGEYMKDIYPELDMLNIKIIMHCADGSKQLYKYRIFQPASNDDGFDPEQAHVYEEDDLNINEIQTVTFQMVEKVMQPLSMIRVRGVYREKDFDKETCQRIDLIRATQEEAIDRMTVTDGKIIEAINITKPNNREYFQQIPVPTYTKVTSIPRLVQHRWGGFYSGAIGTFVQMWEPVCKPYDKERTGAPPTGTMTWFTYPLYDTTQWVKQGSCEKFIAYVVNENVHDAHDRTWRFVGGILRVVLRRTATPGEKGEDRPVNRARSWKNTQPDEYLYDPVIIQPGIVIGSENRLHKEIIGIPRRDGLDEVPDHGDSTSNNYYAGASASARNLGTRMDFSWHRSEPIYIKPGMPCRLHVEQDKHVVIYDGIVIFMHTLITMDGIGLQADKHKNTTYFSMIVTEVK